MKSIFLFFILFQNIILRYLPNIGILTYWDESCFLLVLLWYVLTLIKNPMKHDDAVFIALSISICVVGLLGNLLYGYQESVGAIIRDIVGFLKFPLSFLSLMRLKAAERFAVRLYKLIPYIKAIVWIMFICGICSLFFDLGMSQNEIRGGIHPFMFLYTHPTYLTTGVICILCIFNASGDINPKYDIVLSAIVILGMRTKGLAIIAVYFFMKYSGRWLRRVRVLYWTVMGAVVLVMSYSKLAMYASWSSSPRESLYLGAFQLMRECFPVGSGFGTYASHLSGRYLSAVYHFIRITDMYNYDGSISAVIGDAGLPYYMGQFGILGCLLIAFLVCQILKMPQKAVNQALRFPITMFWVLILISLPSEAILVNDGFILAFILVMLIRLSILRQTESLPNRNLPKFILTAKH